MIKTMLCAIAVVLTACGPNEPDIPPPIDPPTPPVTPPRMNDLGFTPHVEGQPFDTYKGLVMAGYQGWFGGPRDEGGFGDEGWYHYRENNMFKPGVLQNSIDFWPDMSEYTVKYTPGVDDSKVSSAKFMLPDGTPAQVYSAYDKSTVQLHFKWMKDYGIDGVFMQRFVGETVNNNNHKRHFNQVLKNAMESSNEFQRAICVMYDLGGFMNGGNNASAVLADTQEILDTYQLKDRTKQKFYLHHNGKPLIVLWGVGFNDNRPYSLANVEELMNGLREKGFSIMLGVPTYWRENNGNHDTVADRKLAELIKSADVIMPWLVGRFGDNNYASAGFEAMIKQDVDWCKTNGVDYAPLCYPGSSDRNMHPNNPVNPRNGGRFYWKQIYNCINSGAKMLYIAMFDEVDEGTAIYKCLNQKNLPSNEPATDYYVIYRNGSYSKSNTAVNVTGANDWCRKASELDITFTGIEDNLQTDHYLWLTGQARKMLRGEIPMTSSQPVR